MYESDEKTFKTNSQIDTRKILKQSGSKQSKDVYYIPGYLRLKSKNFTQMDLQNLNAGLNATLIFTVFYGNLNENIVSKLQSQIIFLFGRDDARQLTEKDNLQVTVKNNKEKRQIQFSIRQVFQLRIQSDVFFTPFQIINLILSVTIQPVVTESFGTVKINLMDHPERVLKTSYSEQGAFGTYDLAQKKMGSYFSNDRVCKVEDFYKTAQEKRNEYQLKLNTIKPKDKIDQFQYGHFLIPLYRFPLDTLATIFLPLWLLAVINLSIFFQNTSMGDRVGSISGIMIAFVALIPTIRENIPPSPRIVFIEFLVYMNSLTSLFVLIDSVSVRNLGDGYEFFWYESGLFLVSVIITVLSFIIIVVMMILHYFVWKRSYKMKLENEKQVTFKRVEWGNETCDMYFSKMNELKQKNKLQVVPDSLPQIKSKKLT